MPALAIGSVFSLGLVGAGIYIGALRKRLAVSEAEKAEIEAELQSLATAVEQSPTSIVITDLNASILYTNPQFSKVTGYRRDEVIGQNPRVLNSGLTDDACFRDMWSRLSHGQSWSGEFINRRKNGEIYWEEAHIAPVFDAEGKTSRYVAVKLDISERKWAQSQESFRGWVLELLADGAPLVVVVEAIVQGVEHGHPDALCSIVLLEDDGKHIRVGAAPSLPKFYNDAINGLEIGPCHGSCGTAIYTNQRVIVSDIQTHPYWQNYRELAKQARLGSCWSEPIRSPDGKVLGSFAIYHHEIHEPTAADILLIESAANLASIAIERSRAVDALRLSEERHRLLAENASDVIWTMDGTGNFTYISPSILKLRGYTPEEAMKQTLKDSLTPDSLAIVVTKMERAMKQLRDGELFPSNRGEFEQPCKDGSTIWAEISTTGIYNDKGEFVGILGVSRDVTERKRIQDRIAHMAHHDSLTSLPNRALFDDRLGQAMTLAKREKSRLALMFLDLDRFKPVNDKYGHGMGDRLLKEVAQRIRESIRASDTVGRIGGDEFVVLLPEIKDASDALLVAQKIRVAIDQPFELDGVTVSIGSSIGIALYPSHGTTPIDLMNSADMAMYFAKESGRNTVALFSDDLRAQSRTGRRHEVDVVKNITPAFDKAV